MARLIFNYFHFDPALPVPRDERGDNLYVVSEDAPPQADRPELQTSFSIRGDRILQNILEIRVRHDKEFTVERYEGQGDEVVRSTFVKPKFFPI